MKTDILGVGFDTLNRSETLDEVLGYLSANERKCKTVVTPNPEMVMLARKDSKFLQVIERSDLVIPDGVGVVWASRLSGTRLRETVTGCDLCFQILENISVSKNNKVYILGAAIGVAKLAKEKMEAQFPGLSICGFHDGYFKTEDESEIIAHINSLKPDILLVGLGMKRQETWIHKYKNGLDVSVAICCGGTIDIMAGTVKRAPKLFQKLGLEWFYRLISQPSRFFRMLVLPKFVLVAVWDMVFGGRQ